MQEDKFTDILKDHASRFKMDVEPELFDKVMQKRAGRSRRGALWLTTIISAIGLSLLAVGAYYQLKPHGNQTASFALPPQQFIAPESNTHPQSEPTDHELRSRATLPEQVQNHDSKKVEQPKPSEPLLIAPAIPAQPARQQELPGVKSVQNTRPLPGAKQHNQSTTAASSSGKPVPEQTSVAPLLPGRSAIHNSVADEAKNSLTNKPATTIETTESPSSEVTAVAELPASTTAAPDSSKPTPVKPAVTPADYKWALGLLFTGQFFNSAYSANSSADLAWFNDYYANRKNNDKARFCYNAGLKLERKLSKHFWVGTGALLSVIEFQELQIIKDVKPTAKFVNTGVGSLEADKLNAPNIDRNRFDISFTSLEIPLMINFEAGTKRLQWQLSTGISYNLLVRTRSLVFAKNDSVNVSETNDAGNDRLQRHRFMWVAGAYANYKVWDRLGIYAGPVYRHSLNSLYNSDYVIRQKPYFIGVEAGLRFYF